MKSARSAILLLAAFCAPLRAETTPDRIQVEGEFIDTWCYFSGVMGAPEAVQGSAHHTCALWCAAGGIPVGLLTDEGEVYMILKLEGEGVLADMDTLLELQSDRLVADGLHYRRDGIDYLVVETVVDNSGITNENHDEWGVIPGFVIPEPAE